MPITFAELLSIAPTVAEPMLARLRTAGLAMLGTVRADGSPRVSFEIVVTAAAWQYVADDTFITRSWSEGGVLRERHRVGATGDSVDVAAP